MRVKIIYLFFILFMVQPVYATHNRAGEITYKQISDFTYEITLVTYTSTRPEVVADRPELEIYWGDGTSNIVSREGRIVQLPNYYQQNTYIARHTFPGPGTYKIFMQDKNRNLGVINIPGSVNVVFAVQTTLQINSNLGHNNTPVLLNPPIDQAAKGFKFIHNPAAFDPDGDSLSYKLTTCLGQDGVPIIDYSLPFTSDTIYVDEITGDLVWDAPDSAGIYNIAMLIEEWRQGVKIGEIVRDMQIEVYNVDVELPQIEPLKDTCILAGDTIVFDVIARSDNTMPILLKANGGVFQLYVSPAQFESQKEVGYVQSEFRWITNCSHVRKQPYQVIFKAEIEAIALDPQKKPIDVLLADYETVKITVVSPPPRNVVTEPTNSTILLRWEPPATCSNAVGYKVYRRELYYGFEPSHCETGVPEYTGYQEIAYVDGINNTYFLDNNNGKGLWQGLLYCYMITAIAPDGAESYASEEVCTSLVKGVPIITNVSIEETDNTNGEVYVAWSKPTEFDTIAAPGPYKYILFRSQGIWGAHFLEIHELYDINDTTFRDVGINTRDTAYTYQVAFFNDDAPEKYFEIGTPQMASSVFLSLEPSGQKLTLHLKKNVPWLNEKFVIYRKNPASTTFDSITTTTQEIYEDKGLIDGLEYCYYVKSVGYYPIEGVIKPLINYSQIACSTPVDTIPPCTPDLQVKSNCDANHNKIVWQNVLNSCETDFEKYNIYYKAQLNDEFQLINEIYQPDDTIYIHTPDYSLAACYAVTATDKTGNQGKITAQICVDECFDYELPNIFTPDGNNENDYYHPVSYRFVEKVDMQIFNRWGQLVFQTDDPDINWDGKHKDTGKLVSDGVYYYICDVYEHRLTGLEPRNIAGFIHVYAKEHKSKL